MLPWGHNNTDSRRVGHNNTDSRRLGSAGHRGHRWHAVKLEHRVSGAEEEEEEQKQEQEEEQEQEQEQDQAEEASCSHVAPCHRELIKPYFSRQWAARMCDQCFL